MVLAQPADAGPDVLLGGTEYNMLASAPTPSGTGVWTLVSGCGSLVNNTDPGTHVTGLCIGTNVWLWSTIDSLGTPSTDIMEITAFNDTLPPADAGPDATVLLPYTMSQLQGSPAAPPMICTWTAVSTNASIFDPHNPNSTVNDLNLGSNVFQWTCENGPCGTTTDLVNLELVLVTRIGSTVAELSKLFHYEPNSHHLMTTNGAPVKDMLIVDALGRSMPQVPNSTSSGSWDLSAWPTGMYLLRATVDGGSQVYRFVVE